MAVTQLAYRDQVVHRIIAAIGDFHHVVHLSGQSAARWAHYSARPTVTFKDLGANGRVETQPVRRRRAATLDLTTVLGGGPAYFARVSMVF
jgi:hypothetical protein